MTTPKYFKAWIIFFLIATVGGALVGGVAGMFLGATLGVAGISIGMIKVICGIAGFLLGIPISYFTFRWAVGEFIVKELALKAESKTVEPPPMPNNPGSSNVLGS